MKEKLRRIVRALFVISISAFLLIATVMVLLQLAGLVLTIPALVTDAQATLIRPSIVASVVTGFVGLLAFYTAPSDGADDQA